MLVRDSCGKYVTTSPVEPEVIIDIASKILLSHLRETDTLTNPAKTKHFLQCKLAPFEREVFAVLFLDTKHRLISYDEVFYGTIDSASVWPREIVKLALRHNAAAVIFSHNHPSGHTHPSAADNVLTKRLVKACALVEVRVLDHIIVGSSSTTSMAELGLI